MWTTVSLSEQNNTCCLLQPDPHKRAAIAMGIISLYSIDWDTWDFDQVSRNQQPCKQAPKPSKPTASNSTSNSTAGEIPGYNQKRMAFPRGRRWSPHWKSSRNSLFNQIAWSFLWKVHKRSIMQTLNAIRKNCSHKGESGQLLWSRSSNAAINMGSCNNNYKIPLLLLFTRIHCTWSATELKNVGAQVKAGQKGEPSTHKTCHTIPCPERKDCKGVVFPCQSKKTCEWCDLLSHNAKWNHQDWFWPHQEMIIKSMICCHFTGWPFLQMTPKLLMCNDGKGRVSKGPVALSMVTSFAKYSSITNNHNHNFYITITSSSSSRRFGRTWKKLWKHSPPARVPTAFPVLPNFHSCFYDSIETWEMFSIS